jgi:general secretion pathway protein B
MSYILDALKKADSERQHGKTPDIYSSQPHSDALENDESSWSKPIAWFLLVVVVILLAAILLFSGWFRTSPAAILTPMQITAAPAPTPAPTTAAAPIAAAATAAPVVQNAPAAPTPVATAEPALAAPPTTLPAPPMAAVDNPAPVITSLAEPVKLQPSSKLSSTRKEKHHAAASSSEPSLTKKASVTKDADLAVETVSTTFRDLPLNIQNEIPTVTVGGYIYSAKREECQLLINKLILHEGEQVAPGLTLERMMPHSAILNYKGYRYRISY